MFVSGNYGKISATEINSNAAIMGQSAATSQAVYAKRSPILNGDQTNGIATLKKTIDELCAQLKKKDDEIRTLKDVGVTLKVSYESSTEGVSGN